MMRSKNNLKKFGHTSKTSSQKQAYESMVLGEQKRGSTTEDLLKGDFDDTGKIEGSIVEGDPVGKKEKPYRSSKTWLVEHWIGILTTILITVLISVIGWLLINVSGHNTSIAVKETQITDIQSDMTKIESKLTKLEEDSKTLNDRLIKTETILESVEKYLYQVLGLKRQQ